MSFGKVYAGYNEETYTYTDAKDAITGVRVILTDDTAVLEGTEDSVLEVYIPLCSSTAQARTFAQGILTALSGWHYQPFDAGNVLVDPSVQLGDGITAQGIYSTIFKRTTRLDVQTTQDVSAPCEEEVNHEFPWVSGADRKADRKYTDLKDDIESELNVQAGLINAKVSKISPAGQSTFEWAMNDTSHTWYANGQQVMKVDKNGLRINGEVNATSGVIGGCVIENGVLKVDAANVKSLSIGSNFSVDTSGNMVANNGTFTGTLTVGGNLISATDLYTGAAQSAASYGSWNTGTYYAYSGSGSYYNSIQSGTVNYPAYFKCGYITVAGYINMSGAAYTPKTATIAGVTIHYLGTT